MAFGFGEVLSVLKIAKDAVSFATAEARQRREARAWQPIRKSVEWKIATAIATAYVRGVANCGLPPEGVFSGWPRHLREIHSRVVLRGGYALRHEDLRSGDSDVRIALAATCVGLRFVPELCAELTRLGNLDRDAITDAELRRRLTHVLLAGEDVRKPLKPLDPKVNDREFELRAGMNVGVMADFFEAANELMFWARREVGMPAERSGL